MCTSSATTPSLPLPTSSVLPDTVSVHTVKRYSLEGVMKHLEWLFVFGDNEVHQGRRGQSIIRGASNTVGVPTKKRSTLQSDAFYRDTELKHNQDQIRRALQNIRQRLFTGRYTRLVFPSEGLGTGLARLATLAPKTYRFLIYELQKWAPSLYKDTFCHARKD